MLKSVPFLQKIGWNNSQKRLFLWSFGYWASIFNLKNKDRFEHEIVLKILTNSEPRCSYKIVLIKKKKRVYSDHVSPVAAGPPAPSSEVDERVKLKPKPLVCKKKEGRMQPRNSIWRSL